jgi:hypothetical protein
MKNLFKTAGNSLGKWSKTAKNDKTPSKKIVHNKK